MAVDIAGLKLPAVSQECAKVLEMLKDDDIGIQKLCKVITADPVLSSTLLKYANSPIYRRSREVTNINIAVNLLGIKNVHAAAMMATMRSFAGEQSPINLRIWEHSVSISAICRLISEMVDRKLADEMELIGTLHDMPSLVMCTNYPVEFEELIASAQEQGTPHEVLWKELFAASQDDVMVRIIKEFRLPESISNVLRAYHSREPLSVIEDPEDIRIAILALAHYLDEKTENTEDSLYETIPESMETLMKLLNLSIDDVENLIEDSEWAATTKMQM